MHLRLIAPSDMGKVLDDPANEGFDLGWIHQLLEQLRGRGHSYEVVDSDTLPEEARQSTYLDAASRALRLRIRISQVFGSRRQSGASGFGTMVPALLVHEHEGGSLIDVYPHTLKDGPMTTIRGFLEARILEE